MTSCPPTNFSLPRTCTPIYDLLTNISTFQLEQWYQHHAYMNFTKEINIVPHLNHDITKNRESPSTCE